MSGKPENPSAFACAAENGHQEGMSLRDYFAAAALPPLHFEVHGDSILTTHAAAVAKYCYEIADAMLAERGKS